LPNTPLTQNKLGWLGLVTTSFWFLFFYRLDLAKLDPTSLAWSLAQANDPPRQKHVWINSRVRVQTNSMNYKRWIKIACVQYLCNYNYKEKGNKELTWSRDEGMKTMARYAGWHKTTFFPSTSIFSLPLLFLLVLLFSSL